MDSFWHTWRSKFCSNSHSTVVDGCTDDIGIANKFATIFQSASMLNSDVRHDELKSEFLSEFNAYFD